MTDSSHSVLERAGLDQETARVAVAEALKGADDGELYLEYSQSEGLVFDNGRLKSASFDTNQGFGLRAVAGEAAGYAHSGDISEPAIRRAADAVQAVKSGYDGTYSEPPRGTNRSLYGDENPLKGPSFADKVKLLETIDAYARGKDERVRQVTASLAGSFSAVEILRADGTLVRDVRPLVRVNVSVVVGEGDRQEAGSHGMGGRESFERFVTEDMWHTAVDEALRQALVNLGAVPAPAGTFDVVLGPGWPGILLHEAIGHGLEGDFNRKKESAFAGLMGQRVASPGVTIVDDGTIPLRRGSLTVDDEGTPTNSTTLIEDGILVGYMQDRQNARLMGMKPTGNGRRQSYAHIPMPRMTNTYMLSGHGRSRRDPRLGQERHLCRLLRRRPGRHHVRQVRLLLHGGLQDRGRQDRPGDQGRHADRQRAGCAYPGQDDRQRHEARSGHRHLRQERAGRAGRRRPADAQDRPDHGRRHRDLAAIGDGMAEVGAGADLLQAIVLLGAGVVAVPIFKRIGLGSVVGYLVAGVVIGPFCLGLFHEPRTILNVAEFGVVLLLFVIGLELQPPRLWALRHAIFGLGVAQVVICGALLTGVALLIGLPPAAAFIGAMGLALSSTAVVMQILEERGETREPHGQKIFSILLLQDLAIVPLLTAVAFLAPNAREGNGNPRWLEILVALAAVAAVVFVVRFVLNPMFRIFAAAQSREIMTAAALLVVLGAAFAMEIGGLSMAMGAFLAGVLLSESSFRNQLEADIEPFRGLLLGLFFLGVGMSLDLRLIAEAWRSVIGLVVVFVTVKAAGIYIAARIFDTRRRDALRLALLLAQGGEFAFVLYAAAVGAGILSPETTAILTAAVIVSMALTPLAPPLLRYLLPPAPPSLDGVEEPDGATGTALVIGFGRFGQVASQALLARGIDVTTIDASAERIRNATRFGFKVFYGDGTRVDVLRAAGAANAKLIAVCVDKKDAANRIVELVLTEFPLAQLHVRSYDRGHTLDLMAAGVAFEIRETFESALALGEAMLRSLGESPEEAAEVTAEIRRRDLERLTLQQTEGITAGRHLVFGASPTPTPLTPPKRQSQALSEQTAVLADEPEVLPDVPETNKVT